MFLSRGKQRVVEEVGVTRSPKWLNPCWKCLGHFRGWTVWVRRGWQKSLLCMLLPCFTVGNSNSPARFNLQDQSFLTKNKQTNKTTKKPKPTDWGNYFIAHLVLFPKLCLVRKNFCYTHSETRNFWHWESFTLPNLHSVNEYPTNVPSTLPETTLKTTGVAGLVAVKKKIF